MSRVLVITVAVVAIAFVVNVTSQPAPLASRIGSSPVVVELFTSQGCSSCPPADELLGRIARDASLRGRVIPLAFHVDYWNHLGWRDPFSSAEWSQRQSDYVRALGISGAYTPQAVVDGRREFIGSDERRLFGAIEEASKRAANASLSIEADVAHINAPRELELIALTVGDAQTTNVARGENGGRTLTNYAIVQKLTRVGNVRGKADRALPAGTNVVLLQDGKTMEIWSAAVPAAVGGRLAR
ncbi:MAG TPA: DUF1223 domain-containing protein [Thermoanaerobaculia bacterium]|nr:DUF1223 domain-containing protein [Thermoanaerobaculia bacterium]